jgi:uncharacterized membrane protein HdeD (DUF308 family)
MKDMLSNYVLGALACIVMGIALIINPHIITDVLNTAVGVILIAWGGIGVLRYVSSKAHDSSADISVFSLLSNLIVLAGGVYIFINTGLLEKIVMLAIGFYLLCSGIPKIISSLKIKNVGSDQWKLPFVTSLLTTIFGIMLVIAPTKVSGAVMRFVGIVLVIAGVVNFISGFSATKIYKKLEKDVQYRSGHGKDISDTHESDKAKAIDVDVDTDD